MTPGAFSWERNSPSRHTTSPHPASRTAAHRPVPPASTFQRVERTIPDEAWTHACDATFLDGHLYPGTGRLVGDEFVAEPCEDADLVEWLSYFTVDNYDEWAGAAVLCPRAPVLSSTLVRFDDVDKFIAHDYWNPYRAPGVPDWYFFWAKYHSIDTLRAWARNEGLLPAKDLPLGTGGYGADDGLRAE